MVWWQSLKKGGETSQKNYHLSRLGDQWQIISEEDRQKEEMFFFQL